MGFTVRLKKIGNDIGVIFPSDVMQQHQLKLWDKIVFLVSKAES